MDKRRISDQARAWLLAELQNWQTHGIVSAGQSEQILGLYETTADISRRKQSRALFALMSVAAFFVALAALLLIGYNWEAMPSPLKLAVVFGVIFGTHGLGYWLRYKRQAPRAGEIVFFAGCLLYGCGIWLIAQIFHIEGHYPNGLWIWAVGALPFALLLDTVLIHALVAALLGLWVGTEILAFGLFSNPWFFGRWINVPSACFTLPLLAIPGLVWSYRKQSAWTVAMYAALVAWWIILQPVAWRADVSIVYFIGAAGALFLAVAEVHPVGSSLARPYRLFGVLITAGILSVMSFADALREFFRHDASESSLSLVYAILIALAGLAAIVLADRFRAVTSAGGAARGLPFVDILRRQWLPVGLILLMAAVCAWSSLFGVRDLQTGQFTNFADRWSADVLVPTIAVNAAMVAFALWLIRVGVREDQGAPFAGGVLLFLLWAIFRYVDLFAGIGGMLGAALMFFLCGAALFGMGRFWMKRKEISHV